MLKRVLPAVVLCFAIVGCGARSALSELDLGEPTVDGAAPEAASPPQDSGFDAGATADATTNDATASDATTSDATSNDATDATTNDAASRDATTEDATGDATGPIDAGADADATAPIDAGGTTDAAPDAGSPDANALACPAPAFGPNGVEQLPEPPAPYPTYPTSMAVQPDGKIVILGDPTNSWGPTLAVARYNADGTPDTAFGTAGVTTLTPGLPGNLAATVALQPDGGILVAGFSAASSFSPVSYVARLSAAGVLDTSFGTAGFTWPGFATRVWALLVRPDGSFLAVGDEYIGPWVVFLTAFTSAGVVDTSFGANGVTTTNINGGSGGNGGSGQKAAMQADGKVVVAVNTYGNTNIPYLARYTPNGAVDTSFGDAGVVLATSTPSSHQLILSLGLQSTGAIVFTLQTFEADPDVMTLCRFTADGAADTTFGTNGVTTMPFYGQSDVDVVVLPGDALSVGGTFQEDGGAQDLAIARYTPSGALDLTFASGGMNVVTFPGETVNALVSAVLGPEGLVIDGMGQKPSADGGASEPVLDLGVFGCP